MKIDDQTINEFLASLASKEPAPGGGAVSGLLVALSTSLGNMVLAYTEGKKKYTTHTALHEDCSHFLEAARTEAMELAQADAKAYLALNKLWKLDAEDPCYPCPNSNNGVVQPSADNSGITHWKYEQDARQ